METVAQPTLLHHVQWTDYVIAFDIIASSQLPSSKQLQCIKTAIKGHLDGYQSANGLQLNGVKLAVARNLFVTNTITNCDKTAKIPNLLLSAANLFPSKYTENHIEQKSKMFNSAQSK